MSMMKSIIIGLFIGTILIILSKRNEYFSNSTYFREFTGSEIIIPPVKSEYPTKQNELIIPTNDSNNSFPLNTFEPDVVDPVPIVYDAKPFEAYKDTDFRRDKGIDDDFKKLNNIIVDSYDDVKNAYNVYTIPKDSSTDLEYKKLNDIQQRNNMYIHDIHDLMTAKVKSTITMDELNNIAGKPIPKPEISKLYDPVYVSLDDDDVREMFKVDYKFNPYENLSLGSLL
jgi:hypothetical protein